MKQYYTDKRTGISYTLQGDYYLPNLTLPDKEYIGIWGQRHLRYICQHKKVFYTNLLTSGELNGYSRATETVNTFTPDRQRRQGNSLLSAAIFLTFFQNLLTKTILRNTMYFAIGGMLWIFS